MVCLRTLPFSKVIILANYYNLEGFGLRTLPFSKVIIHAKVEINGTVES